MHIIFESMLMLFTKTRQNQSVLVETTPLQSPKLAHLQSPHSTNKRLPTTCMLTKQQLLVHANYTLLSDVYGEYTANETGK